MARQNRLPGESFFEPANGVHLISANASRTEPAKFGVYLALAIQIYVLLEVDFAGNGAIPLDEFEAQLHKRPIRCRIFRVRFTPKCFQMEAVKVDFHRLLA